MNALAGALVLLCLSLAPGCGTALAEDLRIFQRNIVQVYDGDTFYIKVRADRCPNLLCKKVGIRLRGIDAPELKGACEQERIRAKEARNYLADRLKSGKTIVVKDVRKSIYSRLIGTLYIGKTDIAKEMLAMGLVRPNQGEKRKSWCAEGA